MNPHNIIKELAEVLDRSQLFEGYTKEYNPGTKEYRFKSRTGIITITFIISIPTLSINMEMRSDMMEKVALSVTLPLLEGKVAEAFMGLDAMALTYNDRLANIMDDLMDSAEGEMARFLAEMVLKSGKN